MSAATVDGKTTVTPSLNKEDGLVDRENNKAKNANNETSGANNSMPVSKECTMAELLRDKAIVLMSKFDLISKVQVGETLCTSDGTIVVRNAWSSSFKRWWNGDSRITLLAFIKDMTIEYKTMLENKELEQGRKDAVKKKQAEAMMGFNNLKASYASDDNTCKALQEYIEQLNKLYVTFSK